VHHEFVCVCVCDTKLGNCLLLKLNGWEMRSIPGTLMFRCTLGFVSDETDLMLNCEEQLCNGLVHHNPF